MGAPLFFEPLGPEDPREVGPYRVQGRLGRGGMGTVYLGRSRGGLVVAIKVVGSALADDRAFRHRFEREVAAARSVGGFYTAHVVDADADAARPWMATSYIPGPSLHDAVEQHGPLPVSAVRAIGAGLAEGLEAVHAVGLVHRDLKPGNVVIAADGPRVIDFGIARALDATSTLTSSVMGSVAYMPPEQGAGDEVEAPGDVFALGCVLGFAATGSSPFGEGSVRAILSRVMLGTPELGSVPVDLRDLVEACLAPEPGDRPKVAEVLETLTGADGEGVSSDRPWMTAGIAAMVGERSGVAGLDSGRGGGTEDPGRTEEIGRGLTRVMERGRPTAGGVDGIVRQGGDESLGGESLGPRRLREKTWIGALCGFRASEGATLLAVGSNRGSIWIGDPHTGERVLKIRSTARGESLCVLQMPDRAPLLVSSGQRDVTSSEPVVVRIWDTLTGAELRRLEGNDRSHGGVVCAVPRTGSSPLLAYGDLSVLKVWDPVTGRELWADTDPKPFTQAMCCWPQSDGSALLVSAGSRDGAIRVSNPLTGTQLLQLQAHTGWVDTMCLLPRADGPPLLASGGEDGVRLWDATNGRQLRQFSGHMGHVRGICAIPLSSGRALVASVGDDQMVRIWDPVDGRQVTAIRTGAPVGALEYLGRELFVGTVKGVWVHPVEGIHDLTPGSALH